VTWHIGPEAWDHLPCGLIELTDEGLILGLNACLATWIGVDNRSGLRGQPVNRVLSRAASLMFHSYVYPVLRLGRDVEEAAITLQHVSGERMDALMCARRVVQAEQAVVVCTFQRIQERKRLEYQLLMAKRAADEAPGMLFQLSQPAHGPMVFSYASHSMSTLLGVHPHHAAQDAEAVWQAVHPDDLVDVLAALRQAGAQDAPWRCEFRVRDRDDDGWRELHATPWREANGDLLWHGYLADISERRQLEASLRDKAAAERANQAKSAFLSRMSHELRTPLNGILGFAQLMRIQEPDNLRDDQRIKLDYIHMAGHSLLGLINEVLDIARIETGDIRINLTRVDMVVLARKAMALAAPLALARGVRFIAALDADGPALVTGDAQRLEQVMLNLLSNAIKYGPAGGAVQVRLRCDRAQVRLRVCDQGPGFSAAQRAHLFEPFNRLGAEHSPVEGVGLGLVISRGFMQGMGGALCLVAPDDPADPADPGPGACFELQMPRASGPEQGRDGDGVGQGA
jgi:signal transduction histidine kinase